MFTLTEIGSPQGIVSVIAEVHTSEGTLFLGERYANDDSMRLVYVVAFVRLTSASGDYAPEWEAGRYFDGGSTRENREAARRCFLARVSDSLWS